MTRTLFSTLCSTLLLPCLLAAQSDGEQGLHEVAIRGDFQAVHETASQMFQNEMDGVIGAELSLEVPFTRSLFAAGGFNLSQFEGAGDPTNLLDDETKIHMYGPFVKAGYRPYLTDIFYMEFSVKGSYRVLNFESPSCEQQGKDARHTSNGFSATPKLGFWWDTGDGLDFGAVVGHELLWDRFNPENICYQPEPEPADNDSRYRFWHFGFAFSKDLVSSQ